MVINISQIGPTLKTDELEDTIVYFNDQLEEWCKENGVILIKNFLAFKLGTGEVDEICYDVGGESSGAFLSRIGAVRLLSTIKKSCKLFCLRENWDENWMLNERERKKEVVHENRYQNSGENRNFIVKKTVGRRRNSYNHRNSEGERSYLSQQRSPIRTSIHHSNKDAIETVRSVFNDKYGRGCYNCGELNHRVNTCRFDHRLRCGSCEGLGHKRRICQYFNR